MINQNKYLAMIGRPGIGGEFLALHTANWGHYILQRYRRVNTQTDAPRQFGVGSLPADTMIYDLLGTIEAIIEDVQKDPDRGIDLDCHGMDGQRPSLRERFSKLSNTPKES